MSHAIKVNGIKDNCYDLEKVFCILARQIINLREVNTKLQSQLEHQDKLLKQLIHNYNEHICGNECCLIDENEC